MPYLSYTGAARRSQVMIVARHAAADKAEHFASSKVRRGSTSTIKLPLPSHAMS